MPLIMYNRPRGIANMPFNYGGHGCGHMGYDCNPSGFKRTLKPRVDISEDSSNLYLEFDLPGLNKDEIKLSINAERVLTVEGNKVNTNVDESTFLRNERAFGEFSRSFELPDNIDAEKIVAKFENGVLTLTIPKFEKKEQNVEIK